MENNTAGPGNIKQFVIASNGGGSGGGDVDLAAGVVEYKFYESILSNHITATATIIETGNGDGAAAKGVIDGLPLRGGEETDIQVEDAQGNTIDLQVKLHVNRVRDANPGTQQDLYYIDFASKDLFKNETTRVTKRYEGKISDHVQEILSDVLETDAQSDVDDTSLEYNFYGNSKKPFYTLTWLASKSVPDTGSSSGGSGSDNEGGAGGYLFFQTRDGFFFKSIDKIFGEGSASKKFIYNNTGRSVSGYDANILKYEIGSDIDLDNRLLTGAYNNKTVYFDFVAMNYRTKEFDIRKQEGKVKTAGSDFVNVNEDFIEEPSRLYFRIQDIGVNNKGSGDSQLDDWKGEPREPNFKDEQSMVQTVMRYNQLLTVQTNIIIPGDFTIKAGDLVECEFPQLESKLNRETNKQSGGIYMVASVCHRVTPRETFTSLGLVRDSFGKKGGFGGF